ncbi:piggyBac transposable element-derived protein 4-like [Galleria mellonella]|uniref:PiggyBac transposable element-derived protein 4-like n=1 Tax=Galleria mellonella TaxID=7137 RepID=A0ABM3MZ89_GALME|nr:piggyBac transposable element-derived protein 4-like [Galleria mellonella]
MNNHIVFFDNFYTSLPLVNYLNKQGIQCVGTIQQNRLPNCRLPDKKELMKTSIPRGTYEERVSHSDGVDFSATAWKDNKVVTLLSTYVGAEPVGKVSRYDKKAKQKIEIPCPKIVQEYNMHMGGVDLMDSFLGRYRIRIKSRKWYLRLFYHLLDLTTINSWVLMKKNLIAKGVSKKQLPNLGEFRNCLADALCNIEGKNKKKTDNQVTEKGKKQIRKPGNKTAKKIKKTTDKENLQKKRQTKRCKNETESEDSSSQVEDDCACIYCGYLYSDSTKGWVICGACHGWAHNSCAGVDEEDEEAHICERCLPD